MRSSLDEYFIMLAVHVSSRSTCRHRQQGAVLIKDRRVISTGYNGAPSGANHCIDLNSCAKDRGDPCRAEGLHGESNAIAIAARMGIATERTTIYTVYSPCLACCNLLKTAGITEVKYMKLYENYKDGPEHLKELGIIVEQVVI